MNAPKVVHTAPVRPGAAIQADRRRRPDLPARLNRARLVYLLGRSGQPLSDWLPLGLAGAVIGLMLLGGGGGGGGA